MVTIAERLSCAYDRVIKAEQNSPFSDTVQLLAVSKTKPIDENKTKNIPENSLQLKFYKKINFNLDLKSSMMN